MAVYVKLDDIETMPIRLNHRDERNGDLNFVLGIELTMDFIESLPKHQVIRCKECQYNGSWQQCPYYVWAGKQPPDDWFCAKPVQN